MLARTTYTQDEITGARTRIDAAVAADAPADLVILALDNLFLHRQRGKEAKDGALKDLRARAEALAADPAADGPDRTELRTLTDGVFAEIEERFM
ncbi:MAG: hypothetical protein QOI80_3486 [Solirubrobacteraceae bacterium]|jgi:hypothetical protein|nr:hypothetical protein [Solirubrobacteraceae bacterium]